MRVQRASAGSPRRDIEITQAAVAAYGRLLCAMGGRLRTYSLGDGGMICEEWTIRTRPALWRIRADGEVLPDSRYNFALKSFITSALPQGV